MIKCASNYINNESEVILTLTIMPRLMNYSLTSALTYGYRQLTKAFTRHSDFHNMLNIYVSHLI